MWKAILFCDACRTACTEGIHKGSKDALFAAKTVARNAGWVYVKNVGWACQRCRLRPPKPIGDRAYYCGSIETHDHVALRGLAAKVLKHDQGTCTLHVLFEDSKAGRYAEQAHWFFEHEFSADPLEDTNGVDSSTCAHPAPLVEL